MNDKVHIKLLNDGNYRSFIRYYLTIRSFLEFALILCLFPLLIICALIIGIIVFFDQKGKVFFIQQRVGQNNKPFNLIKFRTMKNCTKESGKLKDEFVEISRTGKFLRKHRLDELPQVINILTGDMSLIGPRPHPVDYDCTVLNVYPEYSNRYLIKPGLTGLAQVYYKYTDTIEDEYTKYQFDAKYLNSISIKTDINIILKTIPLIVFGYNSK